ncbi:MAG: hypothetical protein H0T49_04580, partial [Chloroflexia bacterium]|nr:hypothetical protein [Chloroflexia bacterium]
MLGDLPQTNRDQLALLLERAANQISGSAALRDGARGAASGLRAGGESAVQSLTVFGDSIVGTETDLASEVLYQSLARTDYYILSSNRVSSAVPHLPWRYPVQIKFYELLRSEALGFHLVAEFTNYPRLGPIEFADDSADESFLNYDHPHVWIYEKRDLVTEARYAELMAGATTQQVSPTRQAPEPSILLETPVGELPIVDDARWSASLTHNSIAAVFIWIALLFILQLAGWPIAVLLMGRFVDGGWGFARLITILVAGYIVWIGASLEVIQFRAIWAWIAIIAVSSLGWVLFWRDRGRTWGDSQNRRGLRVAFIGELVFWGIFGLFLFYRFLNPDSWHPTWGGEKPMEFAHLNAILRSAHFPPFDPWYSGGYINYYYYGIYLVAFCLKLTGIPSEIAFNLAQPTIMGLLASGGYSLSATLAHHMSLRRGFAVLGGFLGVIFLSLLGNLDSFTKLLTKSPGPIADPFGFWTWSGSRTISGAITEFPYFTGLYADLHAHVVALPVTVLALALAYSLATGAREIALVISRPLRVPGEIVRVVGRLLLLALTLGSLSVSNIWDVPTYFAVSGAALLIGTRQIRSLLVRVALTGALTIAMGLAAYVLFFPFFQHFVTLFGSLGRVREPTSFWEFSNHLGGLIAVVVLGLIVVTLSTGVTPRLSRQPLVPLALLGFILAARLLQIEGLSALDGVLAAAVVALVTFVLYAATWTTPSRSLDFGVTLPAGRLLITIGFAMAVICVALGQTTLAILLALALSAGWVSLQKTTVAARFVAVMVAAAAFVGAGVELVFLAD